MHRPLAIALIALMSLSLPALAQSTTPAPTTQSAQPVTTPPSGNGTGALAQEPPPSLDPLPLLIGAGLLAGGLAILETHHGPTSP